MKLAIAILCIGAETFLVYVLMALVREGLSSSRKCFEVYFARFNPSRPRGELIRMIREDQGTNSRIEVGRRIALIALLAVGLVLPLHGQQVKSGPANEPAPSSEAVETNPQAVPDSVLKELDAMKRRIEQLEAELGRRAEAGDAGAVTEKVIVPARAVTAADPHGPDALLTPPVPPQPESPAKEPFAFADWTWLNGNPRTKEAAFDSKFFTPEIRADVEYTYDFNHPKDDTIGGSSEIFRSNEVGITQLGVGGDFHYDHVRARLMTQFGMYSQTTPRNDASYSRGQWNLADAYRYVSEAYGGYHWDALHGINVDAGIFMSYVGLFSYYNFDNWAYQPSFVSSNTPWFFTGMRIQVFPTEKLKIEPWIINGWQSYARFNGRLGLGGQILYRPTGWISITSNNYGLGADALGIPNRTRLHTDNSIEVKYYDHPERFLDKMAFSVTADAGCESGGGVSCTGNRKNAQSQIVAYKQSFLGYMVYNRWWFHKDRHAMTVGGGKINNPGRYIVLLPPIDGATATSGTPYFTENPGDPFKAWDISGTYDYMPSQYITFRWEFNHRHANVPYWSGPGGITPPGGNNGNPAATIPGWQPDLRNTEDRATMAILVKF